MYEIGLKIPDMLRVASHATRGSDIYYPPGMMLMETDPAEFVEKVGHTLEALIEGHHEAPRRRCITNTHRLSDSVDINDC